MKCLIHEPAPTSISDQEQYLKHIAHFIQYVPGIVALKSKQSKFLSTNDFTANLLGFKQKEDIIGLSDEDLNCPAAKLANHFRDEDQQTMVSKKSLNFLQIVQDRQNTWNVFLVNKTPIILNKITQGIFFTCQDIRDDGFIPIAQTLTHGTSSKKNHRRPTSWAQQSYLLGQYHSEPLTTREQECLFLALYHKTAKQTASILNINHRTVESNLDKIKDKWNCASKLEVIDKAIAKGYLFIIPPSLFNQQLSIRLK